MIDKGGGIVMLVALFLSIWYPLQAFALMLFCGFNAIAVAIDRHLPLDSPQRKGNPEKL